jgi:hypothetical protein
VILKPSDARPPPPANPLERPDYYEADVHALRALMIGNATPDQQKRVHKFLVEQICGTYDMPFRPDSERLTAFAAGKQWVGQTIVWFFNAAPTKIDPGEVGARHITGEQP